MPGDMTAESYRKALLKHGVAVELPSPVHMLDLCSAVMSSRPRPSTRSVVEHGRFIAEKKSDGFVIERNFLLIPPNEDVVRDVILDLMPLASTGTKGGYAALEVLKTLRPSGYPEVKLDASRMVRDTKNNELGDVAAAYAAYDLSGIPSVDPVKVKSIEHDGRDWVVLLGVQIAGTPFYSWDAAEAVPEAEWQPDANEWHTYYGRRVLVGKSRRVLGQRVTFVPDKIRARSQKKRRNEPLEVKFGVPEDAGEIFVY